MSVLKDKRITLIGGAGFIGHHLALALAAKGAQVEIIDSLQINNLLTFAAGGRDVQNGELYRRIINQRLDLLRASGISIDITDARDYHVISRIMDRVKPEVVIHLAAVAHAGRSNKDPFSTFDHSLRTLENVLDFSRQQVSHFIYFSSSMVYGHFEEISVDEESICNPLGIYGALKYAGEKIVIGYHQVFDLPYTIIRPSALYGERCVSRRVGQIFIENALLGKKITVSGSGEDRLDFTYIQDLVQGITRVIENENAKNQIFNLTYGASRSIREMVDILFDHFPEVQLEYLPKDHLTPDRGTLCVDKAKNLLGYDPQFPLERGYAEYIQWYRSICEVQEEKKFVYS